MNFDEKNGTSANSRQEFVVYHNSDKMGYPLRLGKDSFSIVTNRLLAKDKIGTRIWLIAGTSSPRQYTLHCWFIADAVDENSDRDYRYAISGSNGREFSPPIPLNDLPWFEDFLKSQGRFAFGLSPIKAEFITALYLLDKGDQGVQENRDALLVSAAGRVPTMMNRIKRNTALVCKIKTLHEYKCQICGYKIELANGDSYAEVHHIQPLGGEHNGPDVMKNMLCVCPNHHVQLDYRAIRLDLSKLSKVPGHLVETRFVEYHNERVRE